MTAFLINDGRSRQAKTSAGKTRGDLSAELRQIDNLCRIRESNAHAEKSLPSE